MNQVYSSFQTGSQGKAEEAENSLENLVVKAVNPQQYADKHLYRPGTAGFSRKDRNSSENFLEQRLELRTRQLLYYSELLQQRDRQVRLLRRSCSLKIQRIRSFWKDKIYGEGCRTGGILKKALQGQCATS